MLGVPGFVQLGGKQQKNLKPRSLESSLTIALTQLGKLADGAERGIILLCDEAHTLPKDRMTALLSAVNYASAKEGLPVMLVLAGLPALRLQAHQAAGFSGRLFEAESVDKLDLTRTNGGYSEAGRALTIPAEQTDIRWDPDTAEIVAADVEGYPYFIQFYGQYLWRAAARDKGRKVIDEPFYRGLKKAIKDRLAEKIYEETFDEAGVGSVDQDFLEAAGHSGTEVFDIGKVKALLGRTEDSIQSSKRRLISIGIIYKIGQGAYGFSLPGFGDFLQNKHPHRPD